MQEDREKLLKTLEHIQVYFSARADMAIGDGKIVLLGYMKAVEEAIALLKRDDDDMDYWRLRMIAAAQKRKALMEDDER